MISQSLSTAVRITILKRTMQASNGVLRHVEADHRFTKAESRDGAMDAAGRGGAGQHDRGGYEHRPPQASARRRGSVGKANALFARESDILITGVVLAETAWTLSGKRYGLSREDVAAAITALFAEPAARFESVDAAWKALQDYTEATPVKRCVTHHIAGFSDALIVQSHRNDGLRTRISFRADLPRVSRLTTESSWTT